MRTKNREIYLLLKILKTFPGSRILTGKEAAQFRIINPIKKEIITHSHKPSLGGIKTPQRREDRQSNKDRHIYQINKELVFDGGVE